MRSFVAPIYGAQQQDGPLKMNDNELISDLIKIGIPSVVALAGTLSSLILAWWGHKQNLFVKKMQYIHDTEQERNSRTGDLIKSCILDINSLHDNFIAFGIMLFAKVDTLIHDDPWPETEQEVIALRFQTAITSLHKHTTVKSYVMLLGNTELTHTYLTYLDTIGHVIKTYGECEMMRPDELNEFMDRSHALQLSIVKKMSAIYLIKNEIAQKP